MATDERSREAYFGHALPMSSRVEMPLLLPTDNGIYCPPGDFSIDPRRPVDFAVLTHAHADHARAGSARYLFAEEGEQVFCTRLGSPRYQTAAWGESVVRNGVRLSFHPAGHILGSAQVRVEYRGEVAVVSGDYKLASDPTCTPFEPVRCHTFVTESTFGLPVFHWPASEEVFASINTWWGANADAGEASLLLSYSLGKAQRLLAGIDPTIGPIFLHGATDALTGDYRRSGVSLPETARATVDRDRAAYRRALIIAPPSVLGTRWTRRFTPFRSAFASGWMQIRGMRRRRAAERGFVLSDHADWDGLNAAVRLAEPERVFVTHGYAASFSRWLREQGYDARVLEALASREAGEEGFSEAGFTDGGSSNAPSRRRPTRSRTSHAGVAPAGEQEADAGGTQDETLLARPVGGAFASGRLARPGSGGVLRLGGSSPDGGDTDGRGGTE